MHKTVANHQVKFLAAATLLVLIWFFTRSGVHSEVREHLGGIINAGGGESDKSSAGADGGIITPKKPFGPSASFKDGVHPQMLPLDEARRYCGNFRFPPFPRHRNPKRKVYDMIMVNTELDMLEMRLGQLAPYVDYFVILESDKTFTDKDKPLYVKENWDRFKPYHSQMIRHTLDLSWGDNFADAWGREEFIRNSMYSQIVPHLTGDEEAFLDDVLLVSDVDELPKPETLITLRNCDFPKRTTIKSRMFYYSFQWLQDANWPHPQATTYQGPDTVLPHDLRYHANDYAFYEGGWHCSYCFNNIQEMVTKIGSFSHTELDKPEFKDPKKIAWRVRTGRDMYDRSNCTRIEQNTDVPEYLKANSEKFKYMLNRDTPNANFIDWEADPADVAMDYQK